MEANEKIKAYRKETTEELIENYKDLIKKTFEVTDKDLLQEKIDGADEKETEQKYLDAIKKRRVALDEIDMMLDKIEKLEKIFSDEDSDTGTATNYAKLKAQQKKNNL